MGVEPAERLQRDIESAASRQALLRADSATPTPRPSEHAISIARLLQGWAWELIDIDGVTAVAGVARYQKAALGMARRAALRFPGSAFNAFAGAVAD